MNTQTVSAGSLPLGLRATGSAGAKSAGTTSWQHQWQRAQAAGWFCRSDPLSANDVALVQPAGRGLERSAVPGSQLPAALRSSSLPQSWASLPMASTGKAVSAGCPIATPIALQVMASATAATVGVQEAGTVLPVAVAVAAKAESPAQELLSIEQQSPCPAAPEKDGQATPRVHVEEGPQGLRLWLGVDGTPADIAARASAIAAQLRLQCERAGVRLVEVTCNGASFTGNEIPHLPL